MGIGLLELRQMPCVNCHFKLLKRLDRQLRGAVREIVPRLLAQNGCFLGNDGTQPALSQSQWRYPPDQRLRSLDPPARQLAVEMVVLQRVLPHAMLGVRARLILEHLDRGPVPFFRLRVGKAHESHPAGTLRRVLSRARCCG